MSIGVDYTTLNGINPVARNGTEGLGGRLAEKDAGGMEANGLEYEVGDIENDGDMEDYQNRGDNFQADTTSSRRQQLPAE